MKTLEMNPSKNVFKDYGALLKEYGVLMKTHKRGYIGVTAITVVAELMFFCGPALIDMAKKDCKKSELDETMKPETDPEESEAEET